ncbi:TPP1 [Scenedesmus sp. PABB004]|nr:TPP1 [Scenedesmus sp. PABB004]
MKSLLPLLLLLLLSGVAAAAAAAAAPSDGAPWVPVRVSHLAPLGSSLVAAATSSGPGTAAGTPLALPAAQPLRLVVGLRSRNQTGLGALSAAVGNPASAHYQRFLTAAQLAAAFGAEPAALAAVAAHFEAAGLEVQVRSSRLSVLVVGPAAAVSAAVRAPVVRVGAVPARRGRPARVLFAPGEQPKLPAQLAASVAWIAGLDNMPLGWRPEDAPAAAAALKQLDAEGALPAWQQGDAAAAGIQAAASLRAPLSLQEVQSAGRRRRRQVQARLATQQQQQQEPGGGGTRRLQSRGERRLQSRGERRLGAARSLLHDSGKNRFYLTASRLASAYDMPRAQFDGAGQNVAVAAFQFYDALDVQEYALADNLTDDVQQYPQLVDIFTGFGEPGYDDPLPTLVNLQLLLAAAPKATIWVFLGQDTEAEQLLMFETIRDYHVSFVLPVVLHTWSREERPDDASSPLASVIQQMTVQGQGLVAASGDCGPRPWVSSSAASGDDSDGAADDKGQAQGGTCGESTGVSFPANLPTVTAAGGTTPALTFCCPESVAAEAAWGDSGGGVSEAVPLPDYQQSVRTLASRRGRNVPDVSLAANSSRWPHEIYAAGAFVTTGGTAAAAAVWAGFLAAVNQCRALTANLTALGPANGALYAAGEAGGAYNDATKGSNGAYSAGPGWDAVTGWGSMRGRKLMGALCPGWVWDLLTLPDGADIFRVESRQQLECDGAGQRWREAVVFLAGVRVLFWKAWSRTRVEQRVDASDPARLTVDFKLASSGLMSALEGSWELRRLAPAGPGAISPSTHVEYRFAMWPKGVPPALRYMPGLLDAVRGAAGREAGQLLDKVQYVAAKVRPGAAGVAAAVREAAGEVARSGGSFKLLQAALRRAQSVRCHALADDALAEEEEQQPAGAQPQQQQQQQGQQGQQACGSGAGAASEAGSDCPSVYHSGTSSPLSSGDADDGAEDADDDLPRPGDQGPRGGADAAAFIDDAPATGAAAGGAGKQPAGAAAAAGPLAARGAA